MQSTPTSITKSSHDLRRWLLLAALILISVPWASWCWAAIPLLGAILVAGAHREHDLEIEWVLLGCLVLLTALSIFGSISWDLAQLLEHVQIYVFSEAVVFSSATLVSRALIVFLLLLSLRNDTRLVRFAIALNLFIPTGAWLFFQTVGSTVGLTYKTIGEILALYWLGLIVLNGILFFSLTAHRTRPVQTIRWTFTFVTILITLAVAGQTRSISTEIKPSTRPRVAILKQHALDADKYFGTSNDGHTLSGIGLYGDMLHWLQRNGFDAFYVPSIDTATNIDAVYIPTLLRPLSIKELLTLKSLLTSGVGLVIVGEHSNVEHCEEFSRPILEPLGIRLRFDTTEGLLGEGLHGCRTSLFAELGRSLTRTPYLTYNRGASLEITDRIVHPILWGEFWLADYGDLLAPDRGFLSDYRLSSRDRLGDLAFMCIRDDAQGRVFVAGDSSPFLNQNLAYNANFLRSLFAFATTHDQTKSTIQPIPVAIVAAGIALTFVGWMWFSAAYQLAVSLLLLVTFNFSAINVFERVHVSNTVPKLRAAISTAENNRFARDPFSDDALTGLTVQLSRAGYVAELTDWTRNQYRPECLFIVNPTVPPSLCQLNAIKEMAEVGSQIVISGSGQSHAFVSYADAFGIRVSALLVGNLKGTAFTTFEAWAIEELPDCAEPIMADTVAVGAVIPMGSGFITVLADDGFFMNKNLEGEYSYDPDNLSFVNNLVKQDQDSSKPF